ncbi:hypothetical protein LCGC14_1255320 [marine sediment metagenome]|uniref:Uncharacterized protein n=1 Tax=marine sediment metagenome TaxID=412755 RepID=A0A0F9NJ07_9ZZZZ
MLIEEKEQVQGLVRQLVVLEADLNDLEGVFGGLNALEKTFSRIRNESNELIEKLNKKLSES